MKPRLTELHKLFSSWILKFFSIIPRTYYVITEESTDLAFLPDEASKMPLQTVHWHDVGCGHNVWKRCVKLVLHFCRKSTLPASRPWSKQGKENTHPNQSAPNKLGIVYKLELLKPCVAWHPLSNMRWVPWAVRLISANGQGYQLQGSMVFRRNISYLTCVRADPPQLHLTLLHSVGYTDPWWPDLAPQRPLTTRLKSVPPLGPLLLPCPTPPHFALSQHTLPNPNDSVLSCPAIPCLTPLCTIHPLPWPTSYSVPPQGAYPIPWCPAMQNSRPTPLCSLPHLTAPHSPPPNLAPLNNPGQVLWPTVDSKLCGGNNLVQMPPMPSSDWSWG